MGMFKLRASNFAVSDANEADLANGRIAGVPAGAGAAGIDGMLSCDIEGFGVHTADGGTVTWQLAIVRGGHGSGDCGNAAIPNGRLTLIGTVEASVAGAMPAGEKVLVESGARKATLSNWTPTAEFSALEAARDEIGTDIVDGVLLLRCLGGGTHLLAKPKTGTWATLTAAGLLVKPAVP